MSTHQGRLTEIDHSYWMCSYQVCGSLLYLSPWLVLILNFCPELQECLECMEHGPKKLPKVRIWTWHWSHSGSET